MLRRSLGARPSSSSVCEGLVPRLAEAGKIIRSMCGKSIVVFHCSVACCKIFAHYQQTPYALHSLLETITAANMTTTMNVK